jgi:hypothetical protein
MRKVTSWKELHNESIYDVNTYTILQSLKEGGDFENLDTAGRTIIKLVIIRALQTECMWLMKEINGGLFEHRNYHSCSIKGRK